MEKTLAKLFTDEVAFKHLKDVQAAVKIDQVNLKEAASAYQSKYKVRIKEGTKKKQLLIEEGKSDGLNEGESLQRYGEFLPSVQTPILNYLHFLTEEYYTEQDKKDDILREELDKEHGADYHYDFDMDQLSEEGETKNRELNHLNEAAQALQEAFPSKKYKTVPNVESFIYTNMDVGTFGRIKKLKALSLSENEEEAHSAWTKCMELCAKYNISMDDIPCSYEK